MILLFRIWATIIPLFLFAGSNTPHFPAYEYMANSIIHKVGNSISKKYNLLVSGDGGSMMHCVKKLRLMFNAYVALGLLLLNRSLLVYDKWVAATEKLKARAKG